MSRAFGVACIAFVLGCGSDGDPACEDRGSAQPPYAHEDGQGTYAGAPCLDSGCHLAGALGPQAPAYSVAGTVFKRNGTDPQAGAIVLLEPLSGGGNPTRMVTDAAGNFFLMAGATNPFPSIPVVTACPNREEMLEGALDPSYGNCNAAGCHQPAGAGPGPIVLD